MPHSYYFSNGDAEPGAHPSKPHLLIIEDHESTRTFLQHALRVWYRTDFASNAEEGFQRVEDGDYDGFLVDIRLRAGREDGIDVLEQIRSDERYAQAPVIAVTAHVMPGDREHFLETGFDAYLGKPFFQDELLTMLDRFFNHRPADA